MRPGMQLLLDALRQRAIGPIGREEWMAALNLAEQENILSWAAVCLRSALSELDPRMKEELDAIDRNARINTFFWSSTLKSALTAFHCNGIPVISLKGPWLAQRLYGDVSLRTCRDLDLLVRRRDILFAEELLAKIGFVPAGHRQDYERPWHRDDVRVELHHDVENPLAFDFDIESAWRRSLISSFQGIPTRLLAPSDELLFLCLHGVRHRFERLSHIVDLAFAFRLIAPGCLSNCSARTSKFANIIALGAGMASRLDPETPIPLELCSGRGNRDHLEGIAERIWQERILRPAEVVDWSAKHKFYLEIESSHRKRLLRRLRHLRILFSRLIDADFDFSERLHLRHTWQVRLMRPVRLLLKTAWVSPGA
jgi:Uncharacterised nucleotidyltransferase